MRTDELDFVLPPELIAQVPAPDRAGSRLLHYRRSDRSLTHGRFDAFPGLLRAGDVLVVNDARVTPARFALRKPSGGRLEGLFLGERGEAVWEVLLRNAGGVAVGTVCGVEEAAEGAGEGGVAGASAELLERGEEGRWLIRVSVGGVRAGTAEEVLARCGRMPLPPYIRRDKSADERDEMDRERYQTVYAASPGSVAAPTAGLHFSGEVFAALAERGVEVARVTLDVGIGTFKPVSAETLEGHRMHVERYTVPEAAADRVNRAKAEGRRVIAVGTTAARVLESQPAGALAPGSGETGIFIRPGYAWKHVDALVTNFHLPRSTLIALVAAFVGLDEQRRIYAEAIARGYRFFSYGDASFLE